MATDEARTWANTGTGGTNAEDRDDEGEHDGSEGVCIRHRPTRRPNGGENSQGHHVGRRSCAA